MQQPLVQPQELFGSKPGGNTFAIKRFITTGKGCIQLGRSEQKHFNVFIVVCRNRARQRLQLPG
jgi:hypothetical protein